MLRRSLGIWLASEHPRCDRAAVDSAALLRTPKGKPYLEGCEDLHFSISHSQQVWCCAFSTVPVGLDLELTKDRLLPIREGKSEDRWITLARRYFAPEEFAYVGKHGRQGFFELWVRKEAYVKCLGSGISHGLATFQTIKYGKLAKQVDDIRFHPFSIELPEHYGDFHIAVCSQSTEDAVVECTVF